MKEKFDRYYMLNLIVKELQEAHGISTSKHADPTVLS